MMKRILALLIAAMMVLSLASCGDSSGKKKSKDKDSSESSEEEKDREDGEDGEGDKDSEEDKDNKDSEDDKDDKDSEEDKGDKDSESDKDDKDDKDTDEQAKPKKPQTATADETVLVDEAGVKITAKGMDLSNPYGPEVSLFIENNSGEDLTFSSWRTTVNGYMVDSSLYASVADGKKANETLSFFQSDLDASGISTIADMEFSFHIYDSNDYEDYLFTDMVQVKTSAADNFKYKFDDSGDVAYEGNGIKIVLKELSSDASFMGPSVYVYIENNSNKDISVWATDTSVNGFMIDGILSSDVLAGRHAVDTLTFSDTDLEENGITSIDEVEVSFRIRDLESYDTIDTTDAFTKSF